MNGGMGTADVGGAWIASYGAARLSVTPGTAQLALTSPTNQTGAYLQGVASTAVDVRTSLSLSGAVTGGGTTVYVAGRRVGLKQRSTACGCATRPTAPSASRSPAWRARPRRPCWAARSRCRPVHRRSGPPGLPPGDRDRTTTISGSVWADGDAAPTAPMISRTDTTASLQAAGSVGLTAYLSGSATSGTVARFGALTVTDVP